MFFHKKISAARNILIFISIFANEYTNAVTDSTADINTPPATIGFNSSMLPGDAGNSYLYNLFSEYPYQKNTRYIYEAEIVTSYMLFGNIYNNKIRPYSVAITPEIKLRMLDTKSNPILAPSYIIHGKFYRFIVNKNINRIKRTWIVSIVHHSNGNSKNIIEKRELDLLEGSFSTNYFLLQHYWILYAKSGKADFRFPVGVGWEYHMPDSIFNFEIPGGMIDLLSENFGRRRIHTDVAMETLIHSSRKILNNSKIRFAIDYTYIIDKAKGNYLKEFKNPGKIPDYIFAVEANFKPGWKNGMGFFTRYRGGQDGYNVYFFKNLWQLQFGVYMEGFVFDSYKR